MELRERILEHLNDSTFFTQSDYDSAVERLKGRSLETVNIALFCDYFTGDYDDEIISSIEDYMHFFDGNNNRVLLPILNLTTNRLALKLSKKINLTRCRLKEGTWRDNETELEESLIDKVLELADAVLFVTNRGGTRYRELCDRVRNDGYLVSRRVFNETRSKKKGRS